MKKSLVTFGLLGLLAAVPVQASPFTLQHTVNNPSPGSEDNFGYGVDVSGNIAIVGAFRDDVGPNADVGTAYLVDTTTGAVTHTLANPNPDNNGGDQFAISVAIDGDKAVVGSRRTNGIAGLQGEAYIYDTATGALLTTLVNPDPSGSDTFGWAVDISGNLVVASALFEDQPGSLNSGAAYVFDATTGTLLNEFFNPLTSDNALFGHSIAIDDNLVAVGVRAEDVGGVDAGAVHVYDATTGNLVSSIFDPTPAAGDNFGWSVDIEDGMVLVGSPNDDPGGVTNTGQAFLFDGLTGNLLHTLNNPSPDGFNVFGISVDLGDGIAAVADRRNIPGQNAVGEVFLFDTVTGGLMQSILNPFPVHGDQFGGNREEGIALDGNTLMVGTPFQDTGATDAGSAYIFSNADPIPTPGALALLGIGLVGLGWRRRSA